MTAKNPDYSPLVGDHRSRWGRFWLISFKFVFPVIALCLLYLREFPLEVFQLEEPLNTTQWEKEFGDFLRRYYIDGETPHEWHATENVTLPAPPAPDPRTCSAPDNLKFDCFPRGAVTPTECAKRGCCYANSTSNGVPFCFYPSPYVSYAYTNVTTNSSGVFASLKAQFTTPYPGQVTDVTLAILFLSDNNLLINLQRKGDVNTLFPFMIPQVKPPANSTYYVNINSTTTGFQIIRKSNNKILFDSKNIGGLIVSNYFTQLSAKIPSKFIYGLQTRRNGFPLNMNWKSIGLFTHDVPPTEGNGYGFYPSYICMESDGPFAHSVSLLNTVPTDVILQPGNAVTFRVLSPYIALLLTLGSSPLDLTRAQSEFLPAPIFPPFWSLGFHLSRFGHKNTSSLINVWNRTIEAKIPFDTQWVDIDYMKDRNDFTISDSFKDLPKFVDSLHKSGMYFVPILDPGVSGSEPKGKYLPYDSGIKLDIFVKDNKGKNPFVGKVWNPKTTVFPDFSHPKVLPYWIDLLQALHKTLKFDGLWLDMNDPSNFLNGTATGCPKSDLETPPYVPNVLGNFLSYNTLCMTALHYNKVPHFKVHNFYGYYESVVSAFALAQIRGGRRPFILSRSGTLLSPSVAGIWTGDVYSTWEELSESVSDVMTFSMLGYTMVGADICGFNSNSSTSLCQRWSQLGAFYTFSRNHNSDDCIDQDPVAIGAEVSARNALRKRYALLPYLYTLMWESYTTRVPVIRPTFFVHPDVVASYTITSQFYWGDAVLIVPVMKEGLTYSKAYVGPNSTYYRFDTGAQIAAQGEQVLLAAPQDEIPLLYRGGFIVPTFELDGATTTTECRKKNILLKIAPNASQQAVGSLYWDDGETIGGTYSTVGFSYAHNMLTSTITAHNYYSRLSYSGFDFFAVSKLPKSVTLNNSTLTTFTYNATTQVLSVTHSMPVFLNFTLKWI